MAFICKSCNIEMKSKGTKTVDNEYIIRRRECPKCKASFKTIEIKEGAYNNTFGFINSLQELLVSSMKKAFDESKNANKDE